MSIETEEIVDGVRYRLLDFLTGTSGYKVGSDGTVWSRWKRIPIPFNGSRYVLINEWRKLKPGKSGSGYVKVGLRCIDGYKCFTIHRLVLEAFVGPKPEGMECRHFPDGDKKNNKLENLQWGTKKENAQDSILQGRTARGFRMPHCKLTEQDALEIIRLRKTHTEPQVAKMFNICIGTVSNITRGLRRWTNLKNKYGVK